LSQDTARPDLVDILSVEAQPDSNQGSLHSDFFIRRAIGVTR